MRAQSVPKLAGEQTLLDITRPFHISIFKFVSTLLFPLALMILVAQPSHAAGTSVTGTISGIPKDSYGIAWAEKYISGDWVEISASYTKDITSPGNYTIDLGDSLGSDVRIWAQFSGTGLAYLTGSDSFTVSSSTMTKNLSLGTPNVSLTFSNPLACNAGSISADSASGGMPNNFSLWAGINESGTVNLKLPTGYTFKISGHCNGDIAISDSVTTTSSLQSRSISIPTPNVSGTISGITSSTSVYVQVQSIITEGSTTRWANCEYGLLPNNSGQYLINLPQGSYRFVAKPNWDNGATNTFVNSYSDSFTVSSSPVVVNFAMSTDPNLVYTISPSSNARGSWANIEQKFTHPLKGTYFTSVDGVLVDPDGKIRIFLEPGTYRINIWPNENGDGYVQTTTPEFTIVSGGADLTSNISLTKANLKFVISPVANAKWGDVSLTNSAGVEYSSSISDSGISFIYLPAGTYTVAISPGNPSSSAGYTLISNLEVTGSDQTVNVTLAQGNVSGTVSPTSDSVNGWVYAEEKVSGIKTYWKRLKVNAQINENGVYTLALPVGTFRVWAESYDGAFIRTPSAEFTVGSSAVVVDISLRSPNVTGTVSPTNKSALGSVDMVWQSVGVGSEYTTYAPIRSDGTYRLYLPDGQYKFKANPSGQWQNYFGEISDVVTVTSTPQVVDLQLKAANVSGTVYPTNKSKNGYGTVERLTSGNWEYYPTSFGINQSGQYSIYLPAGTYRATVHPGWESSGVFQLKSESFTVTSGSNTVDFTLPSSNFSLTITPTASSRGISAVIEKYQSQGYFQQESWVSVNQSGVLEAYLPDGRYRIRLMPSGKDFVETVSNAFDIPTSAEYPIPTSIALSTPNVYGTVTPTDYAARGQACIEKQESENFYSMNCQVIDFNGNFGFKVPDGTYRVIITPPSVLYGMKGGYLQGANLASQYTVTTSEEFSISGNSKTLNIPLSTGNLSGTVTDVAKSAGGWIQVLKTDGAYLQWTNYRAYISEEGKYALQLPAGKYRLQVFPREDATGVVRTETTDFTIGSSNVTLNIALDTPNVTGIVSPVEKSAYGWVYAEQYACKCGWSGWTGAPGLATSSGIKSDGSYGVKVDPGLTRIVAYPRYDAVDVTKTYSDSFTVTSGASSTMSFTLTDGNLHGTISSLANSAGGYVRLEKAAGNNWNWTNYGAQIREDGTYRMQVESGTYRLVASPGWRSSNVVETTSDSFTVSSSTVTVNLTLASPNLTGTVTNISSALDSAKLNGMEAKNVPVAFGYIVKMDGSGGYNWINKYITIFGDGKYSTYVPDGTYQIYIYQINSNVSGLSKVNTTNIVVSGNTVFDFALGESNLRGTISPSGSASWGSVCAQKQNGANWDWIICDNAKEDGSYGLTVSAGTYRIIAWPRWDSIGYSKTTSETVTVGASGVTTLNVTLQSANVKLTINDLLGRPNYNGYVNVLDSDGNYVDVGKSWISQLGKISFSLNPGVYRLEIQPANDRTGVRTITNITVPASGVLESTISLVDGNVQGTARNSSAAAIPCAFVTATAAGHTTVKTIAKNDGTFTLDLTASVAWTISVVDPSSGQTGTASLTPNGTSSNAVTVTTS